MESEKQLEQELSNFLENKIWVTKKIRMEAEQDRKNKNKRLNYLLIYYSGCLSLMSFLNLYSPSGFNISLWASMISLVLPSANLFQYKAGYIEEARGFKDCYLKLSNLENRIRVALTDSKLSKEDVNNYFSEYQKILDEYENQDGMDYLKFSYSQKNNSSFNNKLTDGEERKVIFNKIFSVIILVIVSALPLILIVLKVSTLDMFK
ncbi:TPA: SLATT domain-containing protein [Enterococcus faecalis]|uniref:SLATT domain-containing protein n=1 Tax=Enterococcus TaxID=1350 RepID=UPI00094B56C6|nr:SLATT domain-containing protein [Enterococcus faecalis]EGO2748145.1 SLATT domain-containing protein [Enterococcus faecalis]EGO8835597.1 SLATT domain-containing protein [Enterococcus faecalis]EHQ8831204.1 SLATT domain-containing protein [Enterococcus faecalis]HBI1544722.1 SLATT domain-containing protein [Enterococcus faecalis]HBI1637074.1 SLATT domain-containing protein [Enterococcus faecalis]